MKDALADAESRLLKVTEVMQALVARREATGREIGGLTEQIASTDPDDERALTKLASARASAQARLEALAPREAQARATVAEAEQALRDIRQAQAVVATAKLEEALAEALAGLPEAVSRAETELREAIRSVGVVARAHAEAQARVAALGDRVAEGRPPTGWAALNPEEPNILALVGRQRDLDREEVAAREAKAREDQKWREHYAGAIKDPMGHARVAPGTGRSLAVPDNRN